MPFADLVERHNGVFGGCWCTYFHSLTRDKDRTYESNRDLKCQLVERRACPRRAGLRRRRGGGLGGVRATGGTAEHPSSTRSTRRAWSTAPDYRITCIFVDRRYRRGGVAALALRGALDLISQAGGGVVEGYPHDMSKQPEGKKMSSSFLYNGTRRMYEEAGFTYQRSKGQKNCVMIRTIAPA